MTNRVDELARLLAEKAFEFHREPDEEWNERLHFKVPILYYKLLAEEAIEFCDRSEDN